MQLVRRCFLLVLREDNRFSFWLRNVAYDFCRPSYENLAALFIVDASASSIVRDLANETKNHFDNKLIDVTFLNEQKTEISDLHSKKFDFVLVFGFNATNFRSIDELCMDQTLIVVEIDSEDDFSAKKFSTKFKSCIFWHLPVSDCDVKSSSIYLCDVGLNPKNVAEMFRLKKYQDPFGAKSFVKLLKMWNLYKEKLFSFLFTCVIFLNFSHGVSLFSFSNLFLKVFSFFCCFLFHFWVPARFVFFIWKIFQIFFKLCEKLRKNVYRRLFFSFRHCENEFYG